MILDPHGPMQVRMLAQSAFAPKNGVKVITHGCDDFFTATPETMDLPPAISAKDAARAKEIIQQKQALLADARAMFQEMFLKTKTPSIHL